MRIGISRPSTGPEEARAVFAAAARHGFTGVQAKPSQYAHCAGDPARFRHDYGDLTSLVAPGLIVYWDREHARWPERMGELAPFAAAIGAEQLCLCAAVPRDPQHAPDWPALARSLGAAGRIAEDAGCRLSLHNHVGTVFETETDLAALLGTLGEAPCSLTIDTAHLAKAGVEDLAPLITRLLPWIDNVHLKDLHPDGRFCPLGRGRLDLSGVLAALSDGAYTGWLTVDEESMDVELDAAFAESAAFLQQSAGLTMH